MYGVRDPIGQRQALGGSAPVLSLLGVAATRPRVRRRRAWKHLRRAGRGQGGGWRPNSAARGRPPARGVTPGASRAHRRCAARRRRRQRLMGGARAVCTVLYVYYMFKKIRTSRSAPCGELSPPHMLGCVVGVVSTAAVSRLRRETAVTAAVLCVPARVPRWPDHLCKSRPGDGAVKRARRGTFRVCVCVCVCVLVCVSSTTTLKHRCRVFCLRPPATPALSPPTLGKSSPPDARAPTQRTQAASR